MDQLGWVAWLLGALGIGALAYGIITGGETFGLLGVIMLLFSLWVLDFKDRWIGKA